MNDNYKEAFEAFFEFVIIFIIFSIFTICAISTCTTIIFDHLKNKAKMLLLNLK